jgi:hypothetical protein
MIGGGLNGLDGLLDCGDSPVIEFACGEFPLLALIIEENDQLFQPGQRFAGGRAVASLRASVRDPSNNAAANWPWVS